MPRPASGEIFGRQDAAPLADIGGDRRGDLAAVEIVGAVFGKPRQRVGETAEA